ncbi:MAG: hypothetical protein BWY75_02131 [bacterium ADurb.Bin425]|nr:MAG: hypothetical protein BWY75_02131 [bacterium ADurb.Bin425]
MVKHFFGHGLKAASFVGQNAAGVYQDKVMPRPIAVFIDAVSGDTGGIIDYGMFLLDATIEKCRLAHIGAPDDYDYWFVHVLTICLYL